MDQMDPREPGDGPPITGVEPEPAALEPDIPASETVALDGAPAATDALLPAGVAPGAAAARTARSRWLVGGAVAVAAIALAGWAVMILAARPLPEVLRYVPATSVVVGELRPDLPGDERQHLGNFLAHFPGFADQSSLDAKLDEAFGRVVRSATNGAVDYATQVKPLLAGPAALALSTADIQAMSGSGATPGFLVIATTDGKATCDGTFGSTTAGETHRGVEVRTISSGPLSCAVHDRFMLIGTAADIDAGLDARLDGKGMDGSSAYRSARTQVSGDQVASVYLDGKGLVGMLTRIAPALSGSSAVTSGVADWMFAGVRIVDDAIVVEARAAPVTAPAMASGAPTDPPSGQSAFASRLPADAFGFMEFHGLGANLERGLAQLKAEPGTASTADQIAQALAVVGGVKNVASWMQDLAVAAVPVNDSAGAIVMIRGTDAAAVSARLTQIRNLLVLAGTGSDLTMKDSDHAGVTITTIDVGSLDSVLPSLGLPAGTLGTGGRLTFSLAARDDVLMVGIGDGVIERVLDVGAGASVATSPTYRRAIDLAGSTNDLQVYVAVDALAGWIESHVLPADARAQYVQDVKPYLDHLAGVAEASETTATGGRLRLVLTVK